MYQGAVFKSYRNNANQIKPNKLGGAGGGASFAYLASTQIQKRSTLFHTWAWFQKSVFAFTINAGSVLYQNVQDVCVLTQKSFPRGQGLKGIVYRPKHWQKQGLLIQCCQDAENSSATK